jgi:hypothetical protein
MQQKLQITAFPSVLGRSGLQPPIGSGRSVRLHNCSLPPVEWAHAEQRQGPVMAETSHRLQVSNLTLKTFIQ